MTFTTRWSPGTEILWRYVRSDGATGSARPMRVVRDDAAGLVGWLAPGTPVLRPTLTDGRELRSTPMAERFDSGRHAAAAEDVVGRWGSPFCDRWEDWRPDPGWPTPQLPTELVAAATFR